MYLKGRVTEKQKEGGRVVRESASHPLGHFANFCNRQSRAKAKPGVWNSILFVHMGPDAHLLPSQARWQEAVLEVVLGYWDVGVGGLTCYATVLAHLPSSLLSSPCLFGSTNSPGHCICQLFLTITQYYDR